jgi:hypothetical protein
MAARRTTTTRTTRTTEKTRVAGRQPAPAPEAPVEDTPGLSMGDGLVITTTLLLVAAILLTDYMLGAHFGRGLFFS